VRIEAKCTNHLTPPNNPTMRCSVVQVFNLGRLGNESYQNPDGEIELVFETMVSLNHLMWLSA
jgi:hypothetical protein